MIWYVGVNCFCLFGMDLVEIGMVNVIVSDFDFDIIWFWFMLGDIYWFKWLFSGICINSFDFYCVYFWLVMCIW